jgi:RNA polymerase sigma factor (sigma-70 family)
MPKDSSFADLEARLRNGDQTAAALVVDQYYRRLIALARDHLDRRILSREGPEDVLQSVLKSFFHRCRQGQFRLDSREGLWALLVTLTIHKCAHRADYHRAGRRNIEREVQLSPLNSSAEGLEALAREPTPLEAIMLAETIMRLLGALKPHQQEIVRYTLEGQGPAQVAEHIDVTERTVYRALNDVRKLLKHWDREG